MGIGVCIDDIGDLDIYEGYFGKSSSQLERQTNMLTTILEEFDCVDSVTVQEKDSILYITLNLIDITNLQSEVKGEMELLAKHCFPECTEIELNLTEE